MAHYAFMLLICSQFRHLIHIISKQKNVLLMVLLRMILRMILRVLLRMILRVLLRMILRVLLRSTLNLVVLAIFDTLPVGRSGPYFILLFT